MSRCAPVGDIPGTILPLVFFNHIADKYSRAASILFKGCVYTYGGYSEDNQTQFNRMCMLDLGNASEYFELTL